MSDLQTYLETGEIPSDPAVLAKLYEEVAGAEAASSSDEQVEQSSDEDVSAATGAKDTVIDQKVEDKEPDGILTKDGKHVISYDVLKAERQQRQEALREAEALRAEIERLKSQPEVIDQGALNTMSEEQLAELREYFPEQYEALVAQQQAVLATQQKLAQFEQREIERQAEARRQVALTVQEEIDSNPILSHWQNNNPEIFEKCIDMDNILRTDPVTSNLSLSERFAKVAAAMSQVYGNPVPAAPQVAQSETTAKTATVSQKAPAKPPINSLSDLSGGVAAEASEAQRLEDSSSAEIGDRFMKMTEDQRQAFLNSLG